MPKSVIEKLEDNTFEHAIDVNRFEESVRRKVIGHIREMADEINAILSDMSIAPSVTDDRLDALLKQVGSIITDSTSNARNELRQQLIDFAPLEEKATVGQLNDSIQTTVFTQQLTPAQLRAIVDDTKIRGALTSEWWDRMDQNTQNRIIKGIQLGFSEGESIEEMKDRLLGKRTGNFETFVVGDQTKRRMERKGGWIKMTDREAEGLVRTAVHKVSTDVREDTFKANSDVIDAIESVAVLDSRTSTLCASYDGLRWTLKGRPLGGHGKRMITPPRHWNCRSSHVPVISGLDELDRLALQKGVKIPKAVRASIDGGQPATTSMEKWLKKQSKTRQDLIVGGKAKGDLFRGGKLKLPDFTNKRGDPLTLKELELKV